MDNMLKTKQVRLDMLAVEKRNRELEEENAKLKEAAQDVVDASNGTAMPSWSRNAIEELAALLEEK